MTDRALAAIKRELEAAELLPLRQHVDDLAQKLEMETDRADDAEARCDYWRNAFLEFQQEVGEELQAACMAAGITQDGQIGVVDTSQTNAALYDAAHEMLAMLRQIVAIADGEPSALVGHVVEHVLDVRRMIAIAEGRA